MNKKSKVKTSAPAAFDREFRETAVKLALTGLKGIAEVARELGIPPRKPYGWVAAYKQKNVTPAPTSRATASDEAYLALQKKYRELEQENEILKKAAAWLYLATCIDLYSRKIVGWQTSSRIDSNLVVDAFRRATYLG
ncbi:hypothetical protein BH11CYA1_BH11CYA1_12820 [soil metagenome]